MAKSSYNKRDFRDYRKVEQAARRAGLEIRNGKGDHAIIYSPDGRDSIPYCRREMGTGLAAKIFKKLCTWGIIGLIIYAAILINGGI